MTQKIDLSGQRFGQLVALERSTRAKGTWWKVRCDCGVECYVRGADLRHGKRASCGKWRGSHMRPRGV